MLDQYIAMYIGMSVVFVRIGIRLALIFGVFFFYLSGVDHV